MASSAATSSKKSRPRAIHSDASSSTESVNSIGADSDDAGPPIVLDEVAASEKSKSKSKTSSSASGEKDKSHKKHKKSKEGESGEKKKKKHKDKDKDGEVGEDGERKKKKKSKDRDASADDKPKKAKPPKPPPPQRTLSDTSSANEPPTTPKVKDVKDSAEAAIPEGEEGENSAENAENKENEGEEQADSGYVYSRWRKMVNSTTGAWYSSTAKVKSGTAYAATTVKDTTVNAATKAKDTTVGAATKVKDTTVGAATTVKDTTVSAATKAKDTTVGAATTVKDTTVGAATKTGTAVTGSFASVVQMARKAAMETKHKMGPAADKIYLIHFNDVYNVESREEEPVGGAARFLTAVKSHESLQPMVLFSGDCFAPSILSTFTKGEQMIPVLNMLDTRCAVFGNHDFDFGIDTLMERVEKTKFPWLMSNVIDNETGRPLADGKVSHTVDWCGRKIGLIGLVEKEWLATLSTINAEEVTYTDYVDAGQSLAKELRSKGCQFIVALTHMRTPNDVRLANEVAEIDLILGGHDHVYEKKQVNGTWVLKSGSDFRQFSVITIDFSQLDTKPVVEIDAVSVSKDFDEDNELATALEKYTGKMEVEMIKELGEFECDLEGRFSAIRTQETNLGNFVCDIMVASTNADLAILNSGTFRSDAIHAAGPFFLRDLLNILPMIDQLVLVEVTGNQLLKCLENGVSQYPKLEGRFPQVSGISFAFDPEKPAGKRVDPAFVKIGDEYLDVKAGSKKRYRLVTKAYIASGKDGYDVLADCKQLIDEENGPTLAYAVQNHFAALAMREGKTRRSSVHHQSLVTMSRKTSIVKQLTEDGTHHIPAHMPEKLITGKAKLSKQSTIGDLETTSLNPKVEGRIKLLNKKVYAELLKKRELDMSELAIEEEDEPDLR